MTILVPALAFEFVTAEEMTRRRVAFLRRLNGGYAGPVIVAEGDSWFCYPKDSVWVPDDAPADIVTHLSAEFAVSGVARPGDTSQGMADFFESVVSDIRTFEADVLLISAGGNDLLGGGALDGVLRDGDRPVGHYLGPDFHIRLEEVLSRIERMVRTAKAAAPGLRILLHSYDYARPSGRGPWLREPMDRLGIPRSKHQAIVRAIVKAFHARLSDVVDALDSELAEDRSDIVVVDVRGTLGAGDWYDELHPTSDGFAKIAEKFRAEIIKPLVS